MLPFNFITIIDLAINVYDKIDIVIEDYEINSIFRNRGYMYDKANNIRSINEYSGE
ncbi:hypothetical protein ACTFIN_05870 [Clostridium cagae]|uniref:hypothetical protein n=1 Tax=Clostridium TaxID=1485 RepID=UPI002079FBDE|nr:MULTISPECIES: hypothetical protein [unclassified Clostridium]